MNCCGQTGAAPARPTCGRRSSRWRRRRRRSARDRDACDAHEEVVVRVRRIPPRHPVAGDLRRSREAATHPALAPTRRGRRDAGRRRRRRRVCYGFSTGSRIPGGYSYKKVEAAGVEPLGTTFLDEYLPDSLRQTFRVIPAESFQLRTVWQRRGSVDRGSIDAAVILPPVAHLRLRLLGVAAALSLLGAGHRRVARCGPTGAAPTSRDLG